MISPLPRKTIFHEMAHVIFEHMTEADFADSELTPRNLREVEAQSVAMLCDEALSLEGVEFARRLHSGVA